MARLQAAGAISLFAAALVGCYPGGTHESRIPEAWEAERWLSPYAIESAAATVSPAPFDGEYVLICKRIGHPDDSRLLQRVQLRHGEPIGFESIDRLQAAAIAGTQRFEVASTYGLRHIWYRDTRDGTPLGEPIEPVAPVQPSAADRVASEVVGVVVNAILEGAFEAIFDASRDEPCRSDAVVKKD